MKSVRAAAAGLGLCVVVAVGSAPWPARAQAAAASAPAFALGAAWAARLPKDSKVAYRGAVNHDAAGMGAGTMMYPAPGLVGLAAAIFTHAVIVNSVRNSEKSRLQEQADQVLLPYQEVLNGFDTRSLLQRSLEKTTAGSARTLLEPAATADTLWVLESAPVFVLTQDQRAIVLENSVALFAPGSAKTPAYQNLVRVVSPAEPEGASGSPWLAEQGARLKETSAELLARSFEIALAAAAKGDGGGAPQRTFRYAEGGVERMERAQYVSGDCERVVVRTLRGWLMSVPVRAGSASGDPACAQLVAGNAPVSLPAASSAASAAR